MRSSVASSADGAASLHRPATRSVAVIVGIISVALTIVVWVLLSDSVTSEQSFQFENDTNQIASVLQNMMDVSTNVLFGLQGLFAASEEVTREEWLAYIDEINLPKNYPGISGLSYIKRVHRSETGSYPHTIYPAADKEDFFAITYTFLTTAGATTTYGFDVSSEPVRDEALRAARDHDLPTVTGVFRGLTTGAPTVSVYAPLYRQGVPHSNPAERREALTGFVSAGFRLEQLFEEFMQHPVVQKRIDVEVYSVAGVDEASEKNLLFDAHPEASALADAALPLRRAMSITVGGKLWTIVFAALPDYEAFATGRFLPAVILVAGLILSALVVWIIQNAATSRERAEQYARQVTGDLKQSKEEVATFLNNLATFVAKVSTDNKVLFMNNAAKQGSGFGDKVVGMSFTEGPWFTFDPQSHARAVEAYEKARRGASVTYDDQMRIQTPKGEEIITVNHSMLPMIQDGKVVYVIAEGRDITANKKTEEALREKTNDLERMNRLMINREVKMAELKEQIRRLGGSA